MADIISSTSELFADAEFDARLTDWLEARNDLGAQWTSFCGEVYAYYDTGEESYEALCKADDIFEGINGRTWEDLADEGYVADLLPTNIIEKLQDEKESESTVSKAKRAIVELAEQKGMNQFTLYALEKHLRAFSDSPRTAVLENIFGSESRLSYIDQQVRLHAGELLTIIAGASVKAGVLCEGGITLVNTDIVFPQEQPAAVGSTFLLNHPEPYDLKRLAASTVDFDREEMRVLQPVELLNAKLWRLKPVLLFGDTHIEGPILPVSPEAWAAEEGSELLRRILFVGHAATSDHKISGLI